MNMHGVVNQIAAHEKTTISLGHGLRDGGFVFVKILQNKGGGNYILSVGDKKIHGTSPFNLQEGSVLRVQIKLSSGQIKLIPEEFSNFSELQLVKYNSDTIQNNQIPNKIADALINLGLPPDSISLKLMSFLQQMGLKIDTQLLAKCRRIASKFSGRQSEAAEVALFLAEKGIEPDEEKVAELLNLFLCDYPTDFKEKNTKQDDNFLSFEEKEIDNIFFKLFGVKPSSLPKSYGLLTLLNHLSTKKKHWIVLPFQCVFDSEKKSSPLFSSGNIRVLLDVQEKNIEKILLRFQTDTFEYNFMLYYNSSHVSKIVFNRSPDFENKGKENLAEQNLFDLFGVKTSYTKKSLIDSFFVDEVESVLAVRLEV